MIECVVNGGSGRDGSLSLHERFVGLASMYPFVSTAERADMPFDAFDKTVGQSLLIAAGRSADGAGFADPGQGPVQMCGRGFVHRLCSVRSAI